MKEILIPTDFSRNAWNALKYASAFYKDEDCHFLLLNAYEVPRTSADMLISLNDIMRRDSEKGLAGWLLKAKKELKNPKHVYSVYSQLGNAASLVSQIIKKEHISMVVMGTKGASGIAEVMMGSVASKVIQKASCPVLAIPEKTHFKPPVKLLFASDYHKISNEKVLKSLVDIAKKYQSKLKILHVCEKGLLNTEEAVAGVKLDHYFEKIPHEFLFVEPDIPSEGIQKYMDKNTQDMLVMQTHHYDLFERIFHRSEVSKVVFHIHIPFLALPD